MDTKHEMEIQKRYITEQNSNIPMGVSQWREHGKKFGYWKYFLKARDEEEYQQGYDDRTLEADHELEEALKVRDGEWLSCLPKIDVFGEGLDGQTRTILINEIRQNAKAKGLLK